MEKNNYQIQTVDGFVLGCYSAHSPEDAINEMVLDRFCQYKNYEEYLDYTGGRNFRVLDGWRIIL